MQAQTGSVAAGGCVMAWHQGQAYGQDLRDRVLAASGSIAEVATRFKVSQSYVARARSRRRRVGDDSPGAQHNHVRLKLSGLEHGLAARIQASNDQTLKQLCQWLQAEHGVQVSVTTLWKTLARLGLSLKKRRCMQQNRNART
jgi:transposase